VVGKTALTSTTNNGLKLHSLCLCA